MDELVKSLPEIIEKAAASPLGILALMIIGLAILAFFFFRGAQEKTVVIFVMLFFGVVAFGAAVVWKAKSRDKGLTLVASIWKAESGRQNTELATKEFSSGAGHGVPAATLKEFAKWVSNRLELTAHTVSVRSTSYAIK